MKTILGVLFMLISNLSFAGDVFEIVSFKFKDGVKVEEQKKLMVELDKVLIGYEGFKSRDYYFSPEDGRWIDLVVWTDVKLAKKASDTAMKDPKAAVVFSKIDDKTTVFSHYERVGGVKK